MTTDAIWLTAVLLFFGSFGVTLFSVWIWSNLPAPQPKPKPVPARRPESLSETILNAH